MKPSLLFIALGWFGACFFVHFLIWRVRRVKREIFWLVFSFLILTPALLLIFTAERWAVLLVYAALSTAYLQTYPVLKADIPTFRLLLLIHQSGPRGLTEEELLKTMLPRMGLYDYKLRELEDDAFVRQKDGRLFLTPFGRAVTAFFTAYRRFLRMEGGLG